MKQDHAVHDPHAPDPMDLARDQRQREEDEVRDAAAKLYAPACNDCADVEAVPGHPPEYWKCKSPQGEIHYTSPLTGQPTTKRVWEFCEGERSKTSEGCGPSGKWFRLKPVPVDGAGTDGPGPIPGTVGQPSIRP